MEIIIGIIVVAIIALMIYSNQQVKNLDANKDGKVNLEDAKVVVENTVNTVKKVADVNKDGKVNTKDAKAAVQKTKVAAKRGRKPKKA
jgi:PAB1-binding protein PBP1